MEKRIVVSQRERKSEKPTVEEAAMEGEQRCYHDKAFSIKPKNRRKEGRTWIHCEFLFNIVQYSKFEGLAKSICDQVLLSIAPLHRFYCFYRLISEELLTYTHLNHPMVLYRHAFTVNTLQRQRKIKQKKKAYTTIIIASLYLDVDEDIMAVAKEN